MTAGLRFLCALQAEAKPVIAHYGLSSVSSSGPFRVYVSRDAGVWLVISGVGKVAAAAAVAHLAVVSQTTPAHAWVNIGICGHDKGPVGRLLRAHKVVDVGSEKVSYPPLIHSISCETATLYTVDQPSSDYPKPGMFDMEAAGFYATASRYTSHELIQVLKVVSDCPDKPVRRFQKSEVSSLIEAALPVLDELVEVSLRLSTEEATRLADPARMADFLGLWHFSESQRIQLRKLLIRWEALSEVEVSVDEFRGSAASREVLRALTNQVEALPIEWSRG